MSVKVILNDACVSFVNTNLAMMRLICAKGMSGSYFNPKSKENKFA